MTIVIQRLSAAARATFAPLPGHVAHSMPPMIEGCAGPDVTCDLTKAITPFIADMQRVKDELAAHTAQVRAGRSALAALSDARPAAAQVRSIERAARQADSGPSAYAAGEDPLRAAELRSKCAFVSGAAQSVEAAIAAAAQTLESLTVALGNVAHPATDDAALAVRVERMTQRNQTAAAELALGMRKIEEAGAFIAKLALHANLGALGTILDAARNVDAGSSPAFIADGAQAPADQRTAAVNQLAGDIIAASDQARTAMLHANAVISALNDAVHAIGEDMAHRTAALPASPQQRAAS